MKFFEMLDALSQGRYVARESWNESGEYCILLPGMQYIWKILTKPTPNAGNWLPLVEDLNAEDWFSMETMVPKKAS